MLRSMFRLMCIATLPLALSTIPTTAHALPKGKAKAKAKAKPSALPTANTQPKPTQTNGPKAPPANLPPKPITAKNEIALTIPAPPTSLVHDAAGGAQHWITPVIEFSMKAHEGGSALEWDYEIKTRMFVINPDTANSVNVRVLCYDEKGVRAGDPMDQTVGSMATTSFAPPVNNKRVWCRIDSSIPVVAYASVSHFRRRSGNTPDTLTEQKVVPLFKAQP